MKHVWYAAYGSNLSRTRFTHYLEGGQPHGADHEHGGARDASEPLADQAVTLDGQVYFAWESPSWGGGVAFYDPDAPGETAARAYLVTGEQFSDVASQEMRRPAGRDLPLTSLFRESRTAVLGPGRYETLHVVGEIDEIPVVTFTASWEHREVDLNAPAAAYVKTIASGLADSHRWETDEICDYLLERPGTRPMWTRHTLRTVIDDWTPGEQVPLAEPATPAALLPRSA